MGMDFRIYRHVYVGSEFPRRRVSGIIDIQVLDVRLNINISKLSTVTEQLYHGSKTHWLKEWFEAELEDYIDNGVEITVEPKLLNKLREACLDVLNNRHSPDIEPLCVDKLHMTVPNASGEVRNAFFSELDRIADSLSDINGQSEDTYGVLADW